MSPLALTFKERVGPVRDAAPVGSIFQTPLCKLRGRRTFPFEGGHFTGTKVTKGTAVDSPRPEDGGRAGQGRGARVWAAQAACPRLPPPRPISPAVRRGPPQRAGEAEAENHPLVSSSTCPLPSAVIPEGNPPRRKPGLEPAFESAAALHPHRLASAWAQPPSVALLQSVTSRLPTAQA